MTDSVSETLTHALAPGVVAGHYEIVTFIGAGGMGEVYRAHDRRLGRDVAVKVLPLVHDVSNERVRRFMQEARTTGRINHPNVVAIYDSGEVDGRPFLVTELLEGETLRSHLQKSGTLSVRQVVEFGIQIARGLAAAHDKGIIHRDLKPANIFITRDGHVKILDFGLAKLVHPEWDRGGDEAETISTISLPGTILGSAGYMSPEQIESRQVDQRADLFALGAILYEMLTGTRAFSGPSVPATLGAILKEQPAALEKARPNVPPGLAIIVRRCLEKRCEDRFQSARDLAFSLEEMMTRSDVSLSGAAAAAIRAAAHRVRSRPALSITTLVVVAAVGLGSIALNTYTSAAPRDRNEPAAPVEIVRLSTSGKAGPAASLSGDGRYVVEDRGGALWLIHVPTRSETRIVSEGAAYPRFSPDENHVYYVAVAGGSANLARIPVLGGTAQTIARDVSFRPITFTPDGGRIAFARDVDGVNSLFIAASDGSNQTRLASAGAGNAYWGCTFSPDSARIVCSADGNDGAVMLEVNSASGEQRVLRAMPFVLEPWWLPDGKSIAGAVVVNLVRQVALVSYGDGGIKRLTNDLSEYFSVSLSRDGRMIGAIRGEITTNLWSVSADDAASQRQLTSGVNTYDGNFGISTARDGHLVFASGASGKSIDIWVSDADGTNRRRITLDDTTDEKWPVVSPDSRTVAYVREKRVGGRWLSDIWRVEMDGSGARQLSSGIPTAVYPHFTADGERVLFSAGESGSSTRSLYEVESSGGPPRLLSGDATGGSPSPDGRWLLVSVDDAKGRHLELRATSGTERRTFDYHGMMRRWKPDATAFAFVRGGNIWIQRLDEPAPRQLTKIEGATVMPGIDWVHGGRDIVYSRRTVLRDLVLIRNF